MTNPDPQWEINMSAGERETKECLDKNRKRLRDQMGAGGKHTLEQIINDAFLLGRYAGLKRIREDKDELSYELGYHDACEDNAAATEEVMTLERLQQQQQLANQQTQVHINYLMGKPGKKIKPPVTLHPSKNILGKIFGKAKKNA